MRIYTNNVFKEYEYTNIQFTDLGGKFVIVVLQQRVLQSAIKRQYVPTAYTSTHATEFYRWIKHTAEPVIVAYRTSVCVYGHGFNSHRGV